MDIVCLGLSHHTAPLDVRERVALGDAARLALLRALTHPSRTDEPNQIHGTAREAVVLATCNRTEIYAYAPDAVDAVDAVYAVGVADVADVAAEAGAADDDASGHGPLSLATALHHALAAAAGIDPADIAPHLYRHNGADAVAHLLGVAAGLDSMILGEAQILGQVRTAADEARAAGSADLVLGNLFKHAVRAGRRARVDTEINARAASVPSAAVELAGRALVDLQAAAAPRFDPSPTSPRVIAVIGAGKMAVLAARAFGKDGATHIVVTNRSYARAMELARQWNGCAVTFDHLVDTVSRADIVIASTSAPHAVLSAADVQAAMMSRPDRPLVIVDIAVPRDVEPAAGDVPNVRLLDVDALQSVVATNLAERASAVPHVQRIVDAEAERFGQWLAAQDVTPTIAALRRWADEIRQHELGRQLRRMDGLAPRERELVQALSVALVGKLLHAPVAHLKASAGTSEALQLAATLRALFDLHDGPSDDDEPIDDDGRSDEAVDDLVVLRPTYPAHPAHPTEPTRTHARTLRPRDTR